MAANPRKLILVHKRAPGDTLVLTGLVRDIQLTYPGQFQIDVDTSAPDLWQHNPYLTSLRQNGQWPKEIARIRCQYGLGIREQVNESIHFLPYFHRDFLKQSAIKVPLCRPYPDLHLSQLEAYTPYFGARYWVVLSGGKTDFTAKVWSVKRMQQVVRELRKQGLGVVQIGSNDTHHWHPPLEGATNLVGQTNFRDVMRLIYHADGLICPVTGVMHMAAALQRPCVVLAGGREAWWWEAYVRENKGLAPVQDKLQVPHRFLHTIGLLDCCRYHGCWKNKVVKIRKDRSLCKHPIHTATQPVPQCMELITVDHVMEAVMSYYQDNSLPPITPVAKQPAQETPAKLPFLDLFAPTVPGANGNGQSTATPCRTPLPVLPGAKLETRGVLGKRPVAFTPGGKPQCAPGLVNAPQAFLPAAPDVPGVLDGQDVLDHPDVGGEFTVCVLLYGEEKFYDLHARCLRALVASVPPDRMDLRIGSNTLNAKSLGLVADLLARGICTKHYQHAQNCYKTPVMREMFHDPAHPIATKWVLWLDDDAMTDRNPNWLRILAMSIAKHHKRDNAHIFGRKFIWTVTAAQKAWFEARPWYKNKPWRLRNGQPAANGNKIIFCGGGCWAITAEAIRVAGIPDRDLLINGDDYTVGEQLYQHGFGMKSFNEKKQHIDVLSIPRRNGISPPDPGKPGFTERAEAARAQFV